MELNLSFEPAYISFYLTGELEKRARELEARLVSCTTCPRQCRVNRLKGEMGYCHSGYLPVVSSVCAHHGEEPALSGKKGSGTIFFGNCNMRCVYCQNYQISQDWEGQKSKEADCHALAELMLYLQNGLGCHNINLVSPSHFVPQIVRAVVEAVPMGLRIPLVYNTSGYDSLETIKQLDGIIDIYLPDLRYASNEWAEKFSSASDYVENARQAIKEMYRQVGDLEMDESDVAQRGVIVRHLVLPNDIAGSRESLTWLAREVSPTITVSIMSQYLPVHRAGTFPEIARKITCAEYQAVLKLVDELGLENGWIQEMESPESYVPDFEREGHPFTR